MNNLNKKIIAFLIIAIFLINPVLIYAQSVDTSNAPKAIVVDESLVTDLQDTLEERTSGSQALSTGESGVSWGAGLNDTVTNTGACFGSSAISSAVSKYVSNLIADLFENPTQVHTVDTSQKSKEIGTSILPSWDSIGYCLVNTIIDYIGASTVEWINSGFDGNPSFIDDPDQFFSDIADIEAGNFLNDLTGGYLCSSLQAPIRLNLANYYNSKISDFEKRSKCSFTKISGSLESFMSGDTFSWSDWISYSEPQNNPMGATILAQVELDKRIANKLNTESTLLNWSKGFLSFKDKETGKIKTPGSVIEEKVNQRLGMGENRIMMADEFDEIVTALVNQLIKIAVSEVTSIGSDDDDD